MRKHRPSWVVGEALPRSTAGSDAIASLDAAIAGFVDLDANGLCLQWRNHFGRVPPAHLPRWLLLRILAYRVQAGRARRARQRDPAPPASAKGRDPRFSIRTSFRNPDSNNAGRSQPESGCAAHQRMERQARTSDGPRTWLRLERRNLRQPVAGRQGDDRHTLEWPSLLRAANHKV